MSLQLLIVLIPIAVALGAVLVLVVRWRPERVALLLAMVVVVLGFAAAGVRIADGIANEQVEFHGTLDVQEIRDTYSPPGPGLRDPQAAIDRMGQGSLSSAEGDMTNPRAGSRVLVMWSVEQLAPWLLAALVLVLVFPILRAADRGDPFRPGATRRLSAVGVLLLLGVPALAILRFVVAEAASSGTFASPVVSPALTISIGHILPGVLVLVLVGIFRRGIELRDLERHTI